MNSPDGDAKGNGIANLVEFALADGETRPLTIARGGTRKFYRLRVVESDPLGRVDECVFGAARESYAIPSGREFPFGGLKLFRFDTLPGSLSA